MSVDVVFPTMSEEVDEGVLVTWFVEPGAHVDEGDLIASVQVEKVDEDVYAPAAGDVLELRLAPGDVARQGDVIARIGHGAVTPAVAPAPLVPAAKAAPTSSLAAPASPAARRLARELGVDLATVSGSGPEGRIVEDDVRRAATTAPGAAAAGEPLPGPRRILADRLRTWLASTAQFTVTTEADVTDLSEQGTSFTAAVVLASALALRHRPLLGARWLGDRIVSPSAIDIGIAIALDDGLVVPVVRAADTKDLATLGGEIADLATRAREARLSIAEMHGAVFTVTNLGPYPIDTFTPLLHPPQTAILGVGRARPKPAVVDGRIEARVLMGLSLTVDHQVTDGALAAAFLSDVASLLANPAALSPLSTVARNPSD